jgi:glycosyltransferase involved in cell wall biosynthesis
VKVSAIIPTWNRAETIEGAVRSALKQTGCDLEILVCDDGSTDCTEEVIRSIGDGRVRWIPGSRGGCPAIPRNRGFHASRGEWLAFLDSDDEWFPGKIEKQLALWKDSGCPAVCSNAERLVPGQGICGNVLEGGSGPITFDDLLSVNRVICSSVLVKKTLLGRCGGFPENPRLKGCEDYALWLRIGTQADLAFVEEPLLLYRDDPAASVRGTGSNPWTQRKIVLGDFLRWGMRNRVPVAFLRKAAVRYGEAYQRSVRRRLAGVRGKAPNGVSP